MTQCKDCIYHKMCYWIALFNEKTPCEHFLSTADVAPKSEVAREIFEELDGRLDKICIVANKETEYSSFIGVVQQVFDAVGVVLAELKMKYTEEQTWPRETD